MTVARLGILLLFLLGTVNHVSALCSTPTILCCLGRNDFCHQGCFCDEFCLIAHDCCSDYISTCSESATNTATTTTTTTTTLPPTTSRDVTTLMTVTSPNEIPETTSSSTKATGTTKPGSDTLTSMQSPQPITSVLTSSTLHPSPEITDQTSQQIPTSDINTTKKKEPMKVIFDLTLSTQSRVNTEEAMGSLQNFVRQVEELLRKERCKDCSMKIIQVHQKPKDP